jgi:hypothetical protein
LKGTWTFDLVRIAFLFKRNVVVAWKQVMLRNESVNEGKWTNYINHLYATSSVLKYAAITFLLLRQFVLFKNYVSIIYFFFDTITIYVFWAWFIFWYVCNNFLNKTNNHSYKKRSMLINILIQRGLNITRGFHIRTIRLLWFIRRVKSTTGP